MTLTRIPQDPLQWVRPTDWPALPAVVAGDQKIVGSVRIENHDMNYLTVQVGTSIGTYRVDWGDGTVDAAVASGVPIQHQYTYADADLSAVTAEGFKVAIITITPNTGNILSFSFLNKPAAFGSNSSWSSPILELRMSTPSIVGSSANFLVSSNGSTVILRNLRSFEFIGTHGMSAVNATSMFQGLVSLENFDVPASFTAAFTSLASFFSGCLSLKYCPDLNTAASGSFASMFAGCTSLERVPLMDTSAGTVFQFMFQNCSSLEEIPLLDTHLGSTFASMFSGCGKLRTIPLLNLAAGLTLSSMFAGCSSLISLPTLNTAAATSVNLMFSGCTALQIIPALNFASVSSGTNSANVFNLCTSVVKNLSTGLRFTHAIPHQLSAAELDRYYTNLGTASAQVVTVTGNAGVASDTPTIATAKGWTVTGS